MTKSKLGSPGLGTWIKTGHLAQDWAPGLTVESGVGSPASVGSAEASSRFAGVGAGSSRGGLGLKFARAKLTRWLLVISSIVWAISELILGISFRFQGSRTVNVLPLPTSDSSTISPPSRMHNSLTIDSPSPVPETSRVRLSPPMAEGPWRNFSKMIAWSDSAIPTPVSWTLISSRSPAIRRPRLPTG